MRGSGSKKHNYFVDVFRNFVTQLKPELIVAAVCLLFSMFTQSRAFFLGYTASLVFIFASYKDFKWSKKYFVAVFCALITVLIVLSVCFKTDSSMGRLLIYKISSYIIKDNYLTGVGWSKFPTTYGNYQIEYFRSGNYTTKELLLADNTTFAFNDYAQFFIEGGIAALLIIILLSLFITFSVRASLKKHSGHPAVLMVAISQMIAISVAALFMHVFEKPWFLGIFLLSFVLVCRYAFFYNNKLLLIFSLIATFSGVIALKYGFYLKNYKYFSKMEDARESFKTGYLTESLTKYSSLYPFLKSDINFLNEYADVLTVLGDNKESEIILELLIKKSNSNIFYEKLAGAYSRNDKFYAAEEAYLKAVYRVPNRFKTRLSLFNFYMETKQFKKASQAGKEILILPVKMPSVEVDRIKTRVAGILNFTNN